MEKNCPLCGARMEFRLGEYECTACNFRLPKEQSEPADDRFEQDDGIKRRKLIRPRSSPGQESDYAFTPQDYDTTARVRIKDNSNLSPNTGQKLGVGGLLAFQWFLSFLMLSPRKDVLDYTVGEHFLLSYFLGSALGVLIWIAAMLVDNLIVKYIFIVLSGLSVLSAVIAIVMLIYATNSSAIATPDLYLPVIGVAVYLSLVVQLLTSAWAFYLFYRDIERLS